jgi:hypothetical protein
MDPGLHDIRVDRGVALYRLGRAEEAIADWRIVATEEPGSPSLQRTLARLVAMGIALPDDLKQIAMRGAQPPPR